MPEMGICRNEREGVCDEGNASSGGWDRDSGDRAQRSSLPSTQMDGIGNVHLREMALSEWLTPEMGWTRMLMSDLSGWRSWRRPKRT